MLCSITDRGRYCQESKLQIAAKLSTFYCIFTTFTTLSGCSLDPWRSIFQTLASDQVVFIPLKIIRPLPGASVVIKGTTTGTVALILWVTSSLQVTDQAATDARIRYIGLETTGSTHQHISH